MARIPPIPRALPDVLLSPEISSLAPACFRLTCRSGRYPLPVNMGMGQSARSHRGSRPHPASKLFLVCVSGWSSRICKRCYSVGKFRGRRISEKVYVSHFTMDYQLLLG